MSSAPLPVVEIRSVANAQNEWVALLLGTPGAGLDDPTLQGLFGTPDLLAAIAPLDCIVLLDDATVLTPPVLNVLPANRVLLAVRAEALATDGTTRRLAELQMAGYRVLLDGLVPEGVAAPIALRTVARDAGSDLPRAGSLPALFGPHFAYNVDDTAAYRACENAGFSWFSGDYALEGSVAEGDDGASRRRMLTMLALLARDADSRELEAQLKADPALSYHLLKLVNSAAFSVGTQITSFGQAISRLGRRQLQRWLQLLLYARQHPDSPPNLMLPVAALRGAALEALCKRDGGDRDEQDLAFMAGVFSLLDLLRREGQLGQRLRLAEAGRPDPGTLEEAGVDGPDWWQSQLHAYHWAIQVARNV
jgi:EAL and modified HD-GYP domain-containing signal transduction protein